MLQRECDQATSRLRDLQRDHQQTLREKAALTQDLTDLRARLAAMERPREVLVQWTAAGCAFVAVVVAVVAAAAADGGSRSLRDVVHRLGLPPCTTHDACVAFLSSRRAQVG